jgi:predicted methyltransferase
MRFASLLTVVIAFSALVAQAAPTDDPALNKAVAGANRTQAMVARDAVRHPAQELAFFGIEPTMTVVEIWPEGGYWTEILGPYLHDRGVYYLANPPSSLGPKVEEANAKFKARLDADKADYGTFKITDFGKDAYDIAPPGSADMVLTFRNLHNWMSMGFGDEAFAAFYKALKPGGILGVEEHRGSTAQPQDPMAKTGYVRQDYTVAMAEKAGFKLVGSSEINANPKDTKDWPKGVWTLPPTFALGDQDRAKYAAIGEADNFVLKFQKPTN